MSVYHCFSPSLANVFCWTRNQIGFSILPSTVTLQKIVLGPVINVFWHLANSNVLKMINSYFFILGPTDLSMKKGICSQANNVKHSLNPSEVIAVKQLIAGYRESAAFLLRSADELEQLLLQQNWKRQWKEQILHLCGISQKTLLWRFQVNAKKSFLRAKKYFSSRSLKIFLKLTFFELQCADDCLLNLLNFKVFGVSLWNASHIYC